MKKILLLAVAFCALSFVACKKNYTCDCVTTTNGVQTGSSSYGDSYSSKKKAEEACDSKKSNSSGVITTCTLK